MRYRQAYRKRGSDVARIVAVLHLIGFVESGHAYIDPGSGSYVVQIILATIAGAAFSLRIFWGRIVSR